MNKLYPLATLLATTLLIHGAQAQTYTAVRDGNWHVNSGTNVWDVSGEPPATCIGCTIIITSQVNLNTSVTLKGGSVLNVTGSGIVLTIGPSSGTDYASSYNVIAVNDGSSPSNTIKVSNGGMIDATTANTYLDGLFTTFGTPPSMYFKQVGRGASAYDASGNVANSRQVSTATMTSNATLTADGTLPIILTDFEAVVNNGEVDLTWTTRFEQNSDHFDIERSSNGGAKWDVIGKVAAKGLSTVPVNYSFIDANPGSGTVQYRIHGYDLDGRSTLSPIQVIRTTPLATVSVFPNPAKDYVNVSLPVEEATTGTVSIRLISQTGQLLAEKRVTGAGGTILSFPVSSYSPGNYLVQVVTADGVKQVSKVLISKQ